MKITRKSLILVSLVSIGLAPHAFGMKKTLQLFGKVKKIIYNTDIAHSLLKKYPNQSIQDVFEKTISNKEYKEIKLLLNNDAKICTANKYGKMPLNAAANNPKLLNLFSKYITIEPKEHQELMFQACRKNAFQVIKTLIEKYGFDVAMTTGQNKTLLELCVGHNPESNDTLKTAEYLLKKGTPGSQEALDLALAQKKYYTALLLFKKGGQTNEYSIRSLFKNSIFGDDDLSILFMLTNSQGKFSPSNFDSNNLKVAKFLADNGANGNLLAHMLYLAAKNGAFDVFQYLVEECNLDINKPDALGHTPLEIACTYKNNDIAHYIIHKNMFMRKEINKNIKNATTKENTKKTPISELSAFFKAIYRYCQWWRNNN